MSPAADRNLLVGILALQMEFIDRDQLVDSLHSWVRKKSEPLEAILVQQGALDQETRDLLAAMVDKHIAVHDGRPDMSLASLSSLGGIDLTQLSVDPELQASMSQLTVDSSAAGSAKTLTAGETASTSERFRILRPHAEGGLGKVFVALDGELGREVALKEIHTKLADEPTVRARFVLEAEITGALEHPGIVPVYGLGYHGDGRPFYAMRFVRGDSLKDAVKRYHRAEQGRASSDEVLEFRQLLGRFIDVCNAIDYAHSRGVLHRDLKPGNIMLGKFGETLVVDWGLAKFTSAGEVGKSENDGRIATRSGSGSTPTMTGTALGTPAFMSPEQAAGRLEELGPTSDVYGLGATLYYVLTGHPPIDSEDAGEMLRKVERGDFPPPSAVRPETHPALEAICLKAMSTAPADRYQTAGEMAVDVERWLADEAILAHKDTPLARLARWGRHHRTLVATAIVALLAAIAGLSAITVQQSIANQALRKSEEAIRLEQQETAKQRDLAKRTLGNAIQAISDSLIAVSQEKLLNTPGLQPLRRELLDDGIGYYQNLMKDYEQDVELRVDAVETYLRLGEVVRDIGTAEATLDYYSKSLEVISDLLDKQPDDPRLLQKLATNLNGMGLNYAESGRGQEANEAYTRALEVYDKLLDSTPNRRNRRDMAQTHGNYGILLLTLGQRDEAIRHFSVSRKIRKELAEEYPDEAVFRSDLANDLAYWSVLYTSSGAMDEALETLRECLDLYRSLCEEYPNVAEYTLRLGTALTNHASLLLRHGELADALQAAQESADILGPLSAANPAVAAYRSAAAAALNMLSDLNRYSDQMPEGLANAEQARDVLLDLTAEYPEVDDYRYHLAKSFSNIGRFLQMDGKTAKALQAYQDAAAQLEEISLLAITGRYNLACYRSLSIPLIGEGNSKSPEQWKEQMTERALDALEDAIDSGYTNVDHMRRDSDLEPIRGTDRFELLMQKADGKQDLNEPGK